MQEIEKIKNSEKYFSALEFEEVKLPEEKKNIFQKAINWIRTKNNDKVKKDNEEQSFKPKDKGER